MLRTLTWRLQGYGASRIRLISCDNAEALAMTVDEIDRTSVEARVEGLKAGGLMNLGRCGCPSQQVHHHIEFPQMQSAGFKPKQHSTY